MKDKFWVLFFSLVPLLCMGQEQGSKPVVVAFEYGLESKGQEDIKSIGLKADFLHYHRSGFATSIETKIRRYKGFRSDIENNTLAFGLGYTIKYHFINKEKFSPYVDCGFGAIYSIDRFPTRGTHFNGQYYVGLGSIFDWLEKIKPFLGVRYYHSSNGRGFVMDNPAFDGFFFSIGCRI